jgi:hypothetical protein
LPEQKKNEKSRMRRGRTVNIVDNGGIPFRVHLSSDGPILTSPGHAKVSVLVPDSDPVSYAVWGTIPYTRARVGLCPTERQRRGTGASKRLWWHGGNSLLLHAGEGDNGPLVYIGASIKEFRPRPNDTVVAFVSPMGNSAVPYPYAIGRTHTYLMEGGACIDNATLVRVMASAPRALDPYEVLYGYDLTGPDDDAAAAPREFASERQRMRGWDRNKMALSMPMRVLLQRAIRVRGPVG